MNSNGLKEEIRNLKSEISNQNSKLEKKDTDLSDLLSKIESLKSDHHIALTTEETRY